MNKPFKPKSEKEFLAHLLENPYKKIPKKYHKKRRKHPRYDWSPAKYRAVVGGSKETEGLRNIVKGFDPKDGYILGRAEQWTTIQRAKVRKWFKRLEILQAQPKRIVRARGTNLLKLQDAFHGGIPSKEMKVAFIPDTEPKFSLPGAKKRPPKIKILKEGVSVARSAYERVFIPFNQKALIKNSAAEVQRAADQMPGARLFYIQAGEHQTLNGLSLGLLTRQVQEWMEKYDGVKDLPRTSGNNGDDPKHHHWSKWLNGLIGYVFPKHVPYAQIARLIHAGRKKNQEFKDERNRLMRRRSIKGRK